MPGSGAEEWAADQNAAQHPVSQPAPQPTLATDSKWPTCDLVESDPTSLGFLKEARGVSIADLASL